MSTYTCTCGSQNVWMEYNAVVYTTFESDGSLSNVGVSGVLGRYPRKIGCYECDTEIFHEVDALEQADEAVRDAADAHGLEADLDAGFYLFESSSRPQFDRM